MRLKTTWQITALTNLHVGDECSTGYGIIDKSIQRNPITKLPCINSSSLKGAINEYCANFLQMESSDLLSIFGSNKRDEALKDKDAEEKKNGGKKENYKSQKGGAVFFDANLLALPIHDNDNANLYIMASSASIKSEFENMSKLITSSTPTIEEYDMKDNIGELCDDESLPIIARNCLENGVSKNLWYEQVMPQQSVFYTFIEIDDSFKDSFIDKLNGAIVQIGANATIGYGYCKFKLLNPQSNE